MSVLAEVKLSPGSNSSKQDVQPLVENLGASTDGEIVANNWKCVGKKRRKNRRTRKPRYAPYSARHFLGRPKINAPANTTQFLFDDKELGSKQLFRTVDGSSDHAQNNSLSTSSSEESCESKPCASERLSLCTDASGYAPCNSIEDDKFHEEEFDRMYDDIRMEMLRKKPVDELTASCMELETAIYNMRYLLQKESATRHKLSEMLYLRQRNAELKKENEELRKTQTDSNLIANKLQVR